MKKVSLRFIAIALLSVFSFGNIEAGNLNTKAESTATAVTTPPPPEVQKLVDRVYEIQRMDLSKLSKSEKKELKNELKSVRKDLKTVDVVYIPVTTAIIVLLLLLLLL